MKFCDMIIDFRRTHDLYDLIGWDEYLNFYVKANDEDIKVPLNEQNFHILYNMFNENKDISFNFYFADLFVEHQTGKKLINVVEGVSFDGNTSEKDIALSKVWFKNYDYLPAFNFKNVKSIDEKILKIVGKYGKTDYFLVTSKPWFVVNDVFYWACSDGEEISVKDIPIFERAMQDADENGIILYAARRRLQRPQVEFYNYFSDKEKELMDLCGPEITQYGTEAFNSASPEEIREAHKKWKENKKRKRFKNVFTFKKNNDKL